MSIINEKSLNFTVLRQHMPSCVRGASLRSPIRRLAVCLFLRSVGRGNPSPFLREGCVRVEFFPSPSEASGFLVALWFPVLFVVLFGWLLLLVLLWLLLLLLILLWFLLVLLLLLRFGCRGLVGFVWFG